MIATSSILAQLQITSVHSLRETCLRTSMLSEWPVESTMPMAVEWFMPWQATPLMPSRMSFSRRPASYALLRLRIYNHVGRLMGAIHSFIQRPVHPSFGRVKTVVDGYNTGGQVVDGSKNEGAKNVLPKP